MDYTDLAVSYARRYGLDPEIFVRQMMQESGMNPDAVSPAGALGIAQIMPATARDPGYGVRPIADPRDPEEGLRFGAEYMRAMLDEFGGDYKLALAAYNAGAGAVKKAGGVPPFKETQDYVSIILGGKGMPSTPGGLSMGAPAGSGSEAMPSEELMLGMTQDEDKQALLESLMGRFRNEDSPEHAEMLKRLMAMNAQGPMSGAGASSEGIFSLPEARTVQTATERLAQTP
jgi:hypothetical protein